MPEVTVNCEYPGCEKNITAETGAVALGLLQLHQKNVHDSITAKQKPPKVDRPRLNRGVSAEEFATWTKRYELWKGSTSLTPDEVPCQLIACLDSDLESALIQYHSDIAEAGEAEILKRIKALAVLDVAATVRITEMLGLKQQHGESARSFAARLRGKAQTCAFEVTCAKPGCGTKTQYTDEIVRFVLLAGIASTDISREVLGTTGIDNMSLTDTLALVEAKERAARATAGDAAASVAASRMSAYKKSAGPKGPSQPNPHDTISCTVCGTSTVRYGRNRRGFRTEFRYCSDCFKSSRKRKPPPATPSEPSTAAVHNVFDAIDNIGGISEAAQDSTSATAAADACDNYLYDTTRGWHKGDSKAQPAITLNAGLDHQAYHTLNKSAPLSHTANIECISDSGAMSCLAPPSILPLMGLTQKNLLPVKRRMKTAAEGEISITGAVFLKLSGRDDNGAIHCARVMVYISPNAAAFYLSRGAMEQLRIIPPSFPQVGAAAAALDITTAPCTCPTRTAPPGRPDMLPFPATTENTAKMKGWLLENYKSSTFNRCPHQSLPTMTGPEMEIRVHATCVPSVTRRLVKVPIHWRKKVKEDLDRDVALGVIEKVPPGTPVTWLHNMVLSAKPDGSPRRTVDLQPLNKHSVRETHHTVPPAQQARAVPKHQIMTVTDAWNGYHAIPIKAEDRHKTTFITEYGRYRYRRAPMGFLASGDAYTHRYDMIVADLPRLAKVVDDTLLYDNLSDREAHWWRVIDYLERCGNNGIILNPEKFQFAVEEVDFTAFHLTGDEVKPRPKYLDAIRAFPRPTNITDTRAWFGLVNQVAHYGRMLDIMAPFKPYLSPKTKFQWSAELEQAFQASKQAIVDAIVEGVEIYDPERTTCLQTDFSGAGIGYWLRQKYCNCPGTRPDCCENGWRITLVGSRFLRDAEKRYAAIEGECLAVAWALEDTRWFTLGCSSLVVATDHKPLIRILSDKALENIHNPRIFRLKQRTLMWNFTITHIAGRSNSAADSASRNPTAIPDTLAIVRLDDDCHDNMEADIIATAQSQACSDAVTWRDLQLAQRNDEELKLLHPLVADGFPPERDLLPEQIRQYWQYRDRLYTIDGVLMMDHRTVIPTALRTRILDTLHAAHQGTSGMQSRAQDSVFWPGITQDISHRRSACSTCASMAPSQPHMPPTTPITPKYPFQAIVGDYFTLMGVKYLVIIDRFSGWPHIVRAQYSTEAAGARGLKRCLRHVFATFGVPEEFGSDGGPEFVAEETEIFFKQWGVKHRLSTAYNPESNGRAEVGVKSMKRLLSGNITADGSLDCDKVVSGLLQYRNTPEPSTGMSPSSILFGRSIRDKIPVPPGTSLFDNQMVAPVWQRTWQAREEALRLRFAKQADDSRHGTRDLGRLNVRSSVRLQNLCGNHPKKWDRSGQVVEILPHDQYLVRMHGSGRVVRRNRRHLRQVVTLPETTMIAAQPPPTPIAPLPAPHAAPTPTMVRGDTPITPADTPQPSHTPAGSSQAPAGSSQAPATATPPRILQADIGVPTPTLTPELPPSDAPIQGTDFPAAQGPAAAPALRPGAGKPRVYQPPERTSSGRKVNPIDRLNL